MQGHLGPRDLCLNNHGKEPLGMQCYIPNFKRLSKVVLKKKIYEYILDPRDFPTFLNQGPGYLIWEK